MAHFNDDQAREIIRDTYGQINPHGPAVAETFYAPQELAGLPREAVEFALGVANPVRHANLRPGETVLDLGCGAGIDTLLAARAVGSTGTVIGVDMTTAMVTRARDNASAASLYNIQIRQGLIEELPLSNESVDVAISNGVLNLSTRKSRVLAEIMRVLRPGGRVVISDLVLDEALPEEVLRSPAALAGWLAGTLACPVLLKKFFNVGFVDIAVAERRSFGLSDVARYPLFTSDFIEFLRRIMPPERHAELVLSIVIVARKPATEGVAIRSS